MESKVKLTSLGVEVDEAAVVAVADGFGGGGANVGMTNLSSSNTPTFILSGASTRDEKGRGPILFVFPSFF
jgi:hypothetical protein